MHWKLTVSGTELADKKAAINRGEGQGGADLAIPPRTLGYPS